ncbi:DUF2750 domain-containing protein [Empedobacter brevis]|uniref:DUF2750 domain-containing protein n=1 Tax=Empedobacter brevis TaxID=247 RepID=UPI0028ABB007|nr:DUF2750 domain-containing protein [Empedobacter brevis]
MHIKEIEKVISLSPFERYQYFLKRIADKEKLYTLTFPDGNYAISTIDNHNLFPVWSAEEFALLAKTNGWDNCNLKELNFDDLEIEIFDFIYNNNLFINVFPIDRTGFVVSLEEFTLDLKNELDNY